MKAIATTCALALGSLLGSAPVAAQTASPAPVTPAQRSTASAVAAQGIPLADLAPSAPDAYTVQAGDTLWRIAGLFLRQPWRWPALWGMNMPAIANPHLIYPGQVLYLERTEGMARLRTSREQGADRLDTVKLSPRLRSDGVTDLALPTLQLRLMEPFLSEPLVVDADTLQHAPRIIASADDRVLLAQGDRAYALGPAGAPLVRAAGEPRSHRIFREAKPLRDPLTQEVLGYEAHYLGQAELTHSETVAAAPPYTPGTAPAHSAAAVPATVQITKTKEEVRMGDRLLPEPPRQFTSFVPHAPNAEVQARVVSLYTSTAMRFGTQHQVVALNQGTRDGMAPGMVLSLVTQGKQVVDKTTPTRAVVQLPDEDNGLAIVFRSFDRVSYALIMDIRRGVQVGDLLVTPH